MLGLEILLARVYLTEKNPDDKHKLLSPCYRPAILVFGKYKSLSLTVDARKEFLYTYIRVLKQESRRRKPQRIINYIYPTLFLVHPMTHAFRKAFRIFSFFFSISFVLFSFSLSTSLSLCVSLLLT